MNLFKQKVKRREVSVYWLLFSTSGDARFAVNPAWSKDKFLFVRVRKKVVRQILLVTIGLDK